jgi:Fur family ferric uptake transcriptional regulator
MQSFAIRRALTVSCYHAILDDLRVRGYRLTPQREMIAEAIAHAGRHVTAEEVYGQVQSRTRALNIATVYRTLDLLAELGLVSRGNLGGGKLSYAALSHGPHCHLVCRRCGRVVEVDASLVAGLEDRLMESCGFCPDLGHFVVYGVCAECQGDV